MKSLIEIECVNCGDVFAQDRWEQLCPKCAKLEHHGCSCCCDACEDEDHGRRYGDGPRHGDPCGF